ncbi:MAG: ATP-binding cassette domain-containing protein [Prevotella sp.]|nr:ATP-binding cassette domain-containing protein [Prevotella sp.]
MMTTAIEFNNISKQYRLGLVSTKTLSHDLNRWWQTAVLHKEDPYLKIGSVNDRSTAADSEYVWALKDIDFKVEQGDVVGIIGKNGAGKSTLLKLLSRVTGPTTGTIKARGRIGSLLEVGTGFHPEMTGRENIYMNGAILGMTKAEITRKLDEIVDFSGCERYIDTPVKRYSSGMMVRLGFAVAAHLDPEILVVDEVLAVGDAEFQKKAIGKMQDVSRGEGRTVLFVSHNMASIKNLCKNGVLLEKGMVKTVGKIDDVVAEYMAANLAEVGDVAEVTKFKRVNVQTKEVEIISLKRQIPYKLDSLKDVVFIARVKRNSSVQKFQFTTLIDNVGNGGTRVGMAYSDEIVWPEGKTEAEFEVRIPQHHLTKGKYILDVWTGIGDPTSSCKYYDAVYDTLTFEVESIGNKLVNEWYSYWGETVYPMQVTTI